ncbi:hypothetical protein LINGRAHAP2_LOCUS8325 [Linum grandiflorum]
MEVAFSATDVQSGRERYRFSLIGRIFWDLPKPVHALHADLSRQWKMVPRDLIILEVGHGLLQFVFPTAAARDAVTKDQPGSFKGCLINLIAWELPSQMVYDSLQYMPLTLQLLDLPLHCNTVAFGTKLLAKIGDIISADLYTSRSNGQGLTFVKVKVQMNLLGSFRGRIKAKVENEMPFWAYLRYENLQSVCFVCGLLGHTNRSCPYEAVLTPNRDARGKWMLARPFGRKYEEGLQFKHKGIAKLLLLICPDSTASASTSSVSPIPSLADHPPSHQANAASCTQQEPLINVPTFDGSNLSPSTSSELEEMLIVDHKRRRSDMDTDFAPPPPKRYCSDTTSFETQPSSVNVPMDIPDGMIEALLDDVTDAIVDNPPLSSSPTPTSKGKAARPKRPHHPK